MTSPSFTRLSGAKSMLVLLVWMALSSGTVCVFAQAPDSARVDGKDASANHKTPDHHSAAKVKGTKIDAKSKVAVARTAAPLPKPYRLPWEPNAPGE